MNEHEAILTELNIDSKYWEVLKNAPADVRGEIFELNESIELLHWLMQPDEVRGFAKDRPKDKKGKVIVDLEKPHVLEDMDYFREACLHFKKHGKYTNLYPNRHPNSDYKKFWREERRRCWDGYIRESDGEWISGYYYWYLNYSPIDITVDILNEDGSKTGRADRFVDFPSVWDSDYMYYHYVEQAEVDGEFGAVLKTRGRGYSFKAAAMLARNYFLKPKSKSFAFASDSEYLEDDGLLDNKTWNVLDFIDLHTAWSKGRLTDTKLKKISGYVDPGDKKKKGFKSQIIGVTTGGNPEKGRGKRGKILLYEEGGIFPHLLKTWGIARSSLEDGNSVFGFMLAFGTGGTPGANFEGLEELFYHGDGYRVKMMRNIFDKVKGEGKCAMFIPEYMNRKNCYDHNGNSDPVKAMIEVVTDRNRIRKNATNTDALTQEKAERPFTPQEAVIRMEGSIFPVADLKSHLEDISPRYDSFVSEHYIGDLNIGANGDIAYKPNADATVIREFPIKDNKNKQGAIEIFHLPVRNGMGEIPRFRYIAGIDTYDDDESSTNSLGSIQIMDMLTDEIVAEFTGRPKTAAAFYDICFKMLKFYNAIGNYENDKKGLYAYFAHRHALSYLCDVPEILKDMDMIKGINLGGNKSKGTNSNKKINAWGRRLQADWMLAPVEGREEEGIIQLQRLRSIAYLKEAIGYNEDGNFDRVSSGGMMFILREEYKKYIYHLKDEYSTDFRPGLSEDPFFKVNFKQPGDEGKEYEIEYNEALKLNEII